MRILVLLGAGLLCGALKLQERGADDAIPNILFVMGPFYPEDIMENNRKFFDEGLDVRFYNHNELYPSISHVSKHLEEEANITGAAEAFKMLRPHSYQSDLWRAMTLWEHGGYYLDGKMKLHAPVSEWANPHKDQFALCHEMPLDTIRYPVQYRYSTFMLAAPKRSPLLLPIIQKIIDNVNERAYPIISAQWTGKMHPTGREHQDKKSIGKNFVAGPGAWTLALDEVGMKPTMKCLNRGHVITKFDGVNYKDSTQTLATVEKSVHTAMRTCNDCDAYGALFSSHQVYCDEPGPECKHFEIKEDKFGVKAIQ